MKIFALLTLGFQVRFHSLLERKPNSDFLVCVYPMKKNVLNACNNVIFLEEIMGVL